MTSRIDWLIEAAVEYARRGDWDKVFDAYATIVEENPWLAKTWVLFGNSAMHTERYEDARDAYLTAIGLGENRVICLQNLGCALAMLCDYQGAVKSFLLCIEYDKLEARHWFNLGSAWYQQRRYRDAIAAFVEANELIPEEDSLRFNIYMELGKALLKIKHSGEAESAFSQALELNSKDLDCRLNFAVSLNNQGQRAKAIESLDQTLLLYPNSEEALRVQRKILGNLLGIEPVS